MTQISGKIFQMTNAAGTENRFPRTVMEAVLGLNSYLQNQFGALADIYMPIEGIHESKLSQEFIYRVTPNTIKANTLTLDRIKGKTLVWNQIFEHTYHSQTQDGISCDVNNDGSLRFHGTSTSSEVFVNYHLDLSTVGIIAGHKYACVGWSTNQKVLFAYMYGALPGTVVYAGGAIIEGATTGNVYSYIRLDVASGASIDITIYPMMFDLTLMFGPGHEPSTVAEFEALYPGYYPYNAGTPINNDAEAIETVGFNQWDEEWANGYIWDGEVLGAGVSDAIYSKNFIPIMPNTQYYFNNLTHCVSYAAFYDANMNSLSTGAGTNIGNGYGVGALFTTPSNAHYMRFFIDHINGGTLPSGANICLNLSWSGYRNGEYEPYWKRTIQLGLNAFQVKDGQGNITTVNGLKSAGTSYDEIAGGKYTRRVKRVNLGDLTWTMENGVFNAEIPDRDHSYIMGNGVCSKYPITSQSLVALPVANSFSFAPIHSYNDFWINDSNYSDAATFKTAMNGVYLDYALAAPEVYDLVEPIVTTGEAGETEARISPNVDGISAPMLCDITYGKGNEAAIGQSQYAMVAGHLLNTHKIWGRDFDGTQDVAGALTGVTSITMNGALSGVTTLGVSGAATLGSTLSVAGNTTLSGTLGVSGLASLAGGLKLTTTKKIWFDDTHYIELLNGELHTNLPVVSNSYITAGAVND